MVRKESVRVTKTSTTKASSAKASDNYNFSKDDLENFFKKFWSGLESNRKTALWFVLIMIAIIQLRQIIVGIAFLTFGLLLITGFFEDKNKKD